MAPDGRGIMKDKIQIDSYEIHEHSLALNEVGDYELRITNNNRNYKILNISMNLMSCHTTPHKIEKKDIDLFVRKLQKAGQSQVDGMMAVIKSKDNSFMHLISRLQTINYQMKRSVTAECLIFVVLSIVQIVYMKKLLDDKQII